MSERARAFVESWIEEYVHPTGYEDKNHHSESRANAAACYESALIEGITKAEISEEYEKLVAHMAQVHEQIIVREIANKIAKDD